MLHPLMSGTDQELAEAGVLMNEQMYFSLSSGLIALGNGMTTWDKLPKVPMGLLGYDPTTQALETPEMRCHTLVRAAVAAQANATVLSATALTSSAQVVTANLNIPDSVPRVLGVKATAAGAGSGVVTLQGYNALGALVTDAITLSGTTFVSGVVAFLYLTAVYLPAKVSGSPSVSVGIATGLGLDRPIAQASDVLMVERTALGVWGILTVSTDYSVDATHWTVTPTTLTAGDNYRISYQSMFL